MASKSCCATWAMLVRFCKYFRISPHRFDEAVTEEEPVDSTEGEKDDLNERNPDEIVELLPADGTERRAKHALSGGHPAEEALSGKASLGGCGHADLLGGADSHAITRRADSHTSRS